MENTVTTGKFMGRWRHKGSLMFRAWPMFVEARKAATTRKEIPISGMLATKSGQIEFWTFDGKRPLRFEIGEKDVETIVNAAELDVKMLFDKMVVHCPGTLDIRVKKECWLEVPYIAYPKAPFRKVQSNGWGSYNDPKVPNVTKITGATIAEALQNGGVDYSKVIAVGSDEEVDEDIFIREIVENNAAIVFPRNGVSGRVKRKLMEKAKYWVVDGRRPEEAGGALQGYEITDRFFNWNHTLGASLNKEEWKAEMLRRAHDATREKGRCSRRTYFLENVINRFAERVGQSRQHVTSRFLNEGIIDWLHRSVDEVKPILGRDTPTLLRGRVNEAVNALEFYYRAMEGEQNG